MKRLFAVCVILALGAYAVWTLTLGANLQLAPGVVLKADWQRFARNRDADRSNLGLGWSF